MKIGFDLVYPFTDGSGELSANLGQAVGIAQINADTAIYQTEGENEICRIVIKFVSPGLIKVTQEQEGVGCGFGHNVTAEGKYQKISSKKPQFPSLD